MDWDQIEKYRDRWQIPTQGDQVLLDPDGKYIPGIPPKGKRYDVPVLLGLLDRVLKEYPPDRRRQDDLDLPWFLWNPKEHGLPGHFDAASISRLDRKPVLTLSGASIPAWLKDPAFLRRHLRQFIWTRGSAEGEPRLTVRQIEPEPRELAVLSLAGTRAEAVSRELNRAWLEYMKVRPMTARGYIDNPHGRWLKPVMERAHREELEVREQALAGTLWPPE
jgi:hypothetical protein